MFFGIGKDRLTVSLLSQQTSLKCGNPYAGKGFRAWRDRELNSKMAIFEKLNDCIPMFYILKNAIFCLV